MVEGLRGNPGIKVLCPSQGNIDLTALLDDEEFTRTDRRLQLMLEDLPTLFPDHDYARFAERTR